MSNFYVTELSIALGILFLVALTFIVPLLSSNKVYRAATLFGGLNAGIITISLILDDWAETGRTNWGSLTEFLLATVPKFYVASVIIGAIIIPKYVLLASTRFRAVIFGLLGVISYYFFSLAIANVGGFIYYVYWNSPLPSEIFLDLFIKMAMQIFYFDRLITTILIVSALVAMVATTAIVQKSEDLDP